MSRLCTYRDDTAVHVGLIDADMTHVQALDHLVPPEVAATSGVAATIGLDLSTTAHRAASHGTALTHVTLLAPIPYPHRNVFCVGKNYLEHVAEFGQSGYDATLSRAAPEHPIVFTKPASSVIGPGADVESHAEVTAELDYEAELAVIIGSAGRGIG